MANHAIGTEKESSLHAALKSWYSEQGDLLESRIEGFIVDILRGDLVIEIQTGDFGGLKKKLSVLLKNYHVRVVYPLAITKWVSRCKSVDCDLLKRRKSPQHKRVENLFDELVFITGFLRNPNYSLEVVLIEQEDLWLDDGKGSWRRGNWSILDRKLLSVHDRFLFQTPRDYLNLLPPGLDEKFTSRDVATQLNISRQLAYRMLYCLEKMQLIFVCGHQGRYRLLSVVKE